MTPEFLKKALMGGANIVFAKRMGADRNVRACYAIEFGRRHGFRVVEQSMKQLRSTMENDGGLYFLILKNDKICTIPPFGENPVTELAEELEEETYQKLPRYDFTVQVQAQRLLKKIGFF